MSNSGNGQPPKKETVYSGPTPAAFAARTAPSRAGASGGGTVYNGPAPGGTVFDESKFVAKRADNSLAVAATTSKVRWFAVRFFIVAAVSFFEFYVLRDDQPTVAMTSLFVGLVFLCIGIFAMRLSRIAFLVAMAIYGLNTLGIVLWAVNTDGGLFFALRPLVVHGVILHQLYLNYGLLVDLHTD